MKTAKRILMMVMVFALLITTVNPVTAEAAKRKKPSLSKKKITLIMTNKKPHPSATIKLKNCNKRGTWIINFDDPRNLCIEARVSKDKKSYKITAGGACKGTIECWVKGKRVGKCRLIIKDKRTKKKANTAKKPADKSETDTNKKSEDTESKREMAFVCETNGCGYRIPVTVPGGTDEEKAALKAHMEEHRKKGEKPCYFCDGF